mmetsp:Transcript_41486/g.130694  ORF Transcript_41486/g.130694 Transcript_41486/m.130694 type:complete len:85 (-) Transcript_41486:810-1064(-)
MCVWTRHASPDGFDDQGAIIWFAENKVEFKNPPLLLVIRSGLTQHENKQVQVSFTRATGSVLCGLLWQLWWSKLLVPTLHSSMG